MYFLEDFSVISNLVILTRALLMSWIPDGLLGVTVLSCAEFEHMKFFYFVQNLKYIVVNVEGMACFYIVFLWVM